MPLYEFRCSSCHEQFEQLLSRTELEQVTCPHCGQPTVERQLSTFATSVGHTSTASSSTASSSSCTPRKGFS